MVAIMALMESPAIIVGLILMFIYNKEKSSGTNKLSVIKHSFTNGSFILILGSLIISLLANAKHLVMLSSYLNKSNSSY